MKVIFGIGNPGTKYERTRHNIGFQVIDKLAITYNIKLKLQKNWLCGRGRVSLPIENDFILVKPLSYVNESGISAKQVITYYNLDLPDFLVVLDDFALPLGTTRMRLCGSSGGHNGLESIIYHLESDNFPRLRIGIGYPDPGTAVDFVLSKFKRSELKVLNSAIEKALSSIDIFIKEGLNRAMEVCNK